MPWLSYQLLCTLLEAAPAILSQQQLVEKVWPDTVVGNETLKQRVKLLRRALADNASQPKYIEAIRGRGYRMIGEINKTPIADSSLSVKLSLANDSYVSPKAGQGYPLFWKATSLGLATVVVLFACIALLISSSHNIPKSVSETMAEQQAQGFDNELYRKALDYYHRYRQADNLNAIKLFKSAIEINPNMAKAYAGLSDAYSQGVFQFNGDDHWQQLAVDAAYKAIALDPNLAQAYKALGLAYYNKGWLTKAANANLKALQKQSDFSEAMSNLGFIYREMGQLQRALYWNNKALDRDNTNSVSMVHKAQTLLALTQYSQALEWLDKALLLQPDSVLGNTTLGLWQLQQGQLTAAQSHFSQLLLSHPQQFQYHYGLAQSYLYQQQFELAAKTIAPHINSSNNHTRQHAELLLYLSQQDLDAAPLIEQYKLRLTNGSDRAEDSLSLALIYAHQQQTNDSLRYLIQAINQGLLNSELLLLHPSFGYLQSQDNFQVLITEMNNQRQWQIDN
ncbi:winged helix-turn-helix domain-containing protein [Shewanella sp. 10N.286.54.B9]|uniref:winged helix-turn-helix domain-containing protein n=1 Tax=Shewanella sp. 10N.286.54.B9 TaxID=3229719 RepID=UPI00354E0CAF